MPDDVARLLPKRVSKRMGTDILEFKIETEREDDGRWIAEVDKLPGVLAYGASPEEAVSLVQSLALRVLADRLEHGEAHPAFLNITFAAVAT